MVEDVVEKKDIVRTPTGYITHDNRIFRLVKGDSDLEITSKDTLLYDGTAFKCPVCNKYMKTDLVKAGERICVRCKKRYFGINVDEVGETEMTLPNGSIFLIKNKREQTYIEQEIKEWVDSGKVTSYAEKSSLSRLISHNIELLRIQEDLAAPKLDPSSKKSLQDSLRFMSREVTVLSEELTGKSTKDTSALYVINDTIKDCANYRKDNNLLWEGIWTCEKCKTATVMKGDFITFEKNILSKLKDIDVAVKDKLKKSYDEKTAEEIYTALIDHLKEMAPENYVKVIERSFSKNFK